MSFPRNECTEKCKLHIRELETDVKQARRETQLREEQIQQLDRETQVSYDGKVEGVYV